MQRPQVKVIQALCIPLSQNNVQAKYVILSHPPTGKGHSEANVQDHEYGRGSRKRSWFYHETLYPQEAAREDTVNERKIIFQYEYPTP